MATVASMVNMKGGVGKSTMTFNLAWYLAYRANLRVLAIDLDPQANLSQYFLGADGYLQLLGSDRRTIVDVFEQYSPPNDRIRAPSEFAALDVITTLHNWTDGSRLHLVPSQLELAWTLRNPTIHGRDLLLPKFVAQVQQKYDIILIDCAPTESILTTAAYRSSRYIFVPVKPEFLATIGLPLLARSLDEFRQVHRAQKLDIGGIIFNDMRRTNTPPEQKESRNEVRGLARDQGWTVFDSVAYHSDSYATGSRTGQAIFHTRWARRYVMDEFFEVADEFRKTIEP